MLSHKSQILLVNFVSWTFNIWTDARRRAVMQRVIFWLGHMHLDKGQLSQTKDVFLDALGKAKPGSGSVADSATSLTPIKIEVDCHKHRESKTVTLFVRRPKIG